MQVATSLQTDNHASTPLLSFLQAGCLSCRPTNSVKALKASIADRISGKFATNSCLNIPPHLNITQHHVPSAEPLVM